jgi:hypothetical protein
MSSNACPLPADLQAESAHLGWWFSLHIQPETIPTTMNGFHHHAAVQFGSITWYQNTLKPTGCSNYCAHIHLLQIIHWWNYDSSTNTGDDKKVNRLLYGTLNSLMMGQWGPKHAGVDILKHCCNSDKSCAYVGLHCNKGIIMNRMEYVKKILSRALTGMTVIAYISNIVFRAVYCANCHNESILHIWQQHYHLMLLDCITSSVKIFCFLTCWKEPWSIWSIWTIFNVVLYNYNDSAIWFTRKLCTNYHTFT